MMMAEVRAKLKSSNRGFSLAELVTAVAILGLVMATLAPFLTNFLRHTAAGTLDSAIMQETRWAMDMMQRELMYANSGTVTITGGNTITFFTPAETTGYVTYSSCSFANGPAEVCRKLGSGVQRPITDGSRFPVTALTFSKNPADDTSIVIMLTVQSTDMFGRLHTKTISSRVYTLN